MGWSDNEENTLLLDGFVFIRIYIPSESTKGEEIVVFYFARCKYRDVVTKIVRLSIQITIGSVVSLYHRRSETELEF